MLATGGPGVGVTAAWAGPAVGGFARATPGPAATASGTGFPEPITIRRSPRSRSWELYPAWPSDSEPASAGAEPATDTAYSVPPSSAKIVEPLVLTMSGSSTPISWLFVVEKAGVEKFDEPPGLALACG